MSLQPQHLQLNPGRKSNNESSMSFVACHLRQPFLSQQQNNNSWGMWVSLLGDDKTALVVANIQHRCFDALLQWSWLTSSPPDTTILWNRSYGSDLWKSYFSMLSPLLYNYNHTHSARTLLPGDVILAINGLPISAFGGSIANVTNYLRQCPQLFLVAARSSTPAVQSLQTAGEHLQSREQVRAKHI